MPNPHTVLWQGRRLASYTKDELVEILTLVALDLAAAEAENVSLQRAASRGFLRRSVVPQPLTQPAQPPDYRRILDPGDRS